MICPFCSKQSKVTNSRNRARGTQVWRRRQCTSCRTIWTTREELDLSTTHHFLAADTHEERFSRDELFTSIKDALQHRKTATNDATALTDTVLSLIVRQKSPTIQRNKLIELTRKTLARFDTTAAAVYRAKHPSNNMKNQDK